MSIVALIPARSGSKRIPDKNIKPLAGHPLLAYSIAAAREAGIFDEIVVSTDSAKYYDIAYHYGADLVIDRPKFLAEDHSPDVAWVNHALNALPPTDLFAILRPTSPFRQASTILRAWDQFVSYGIADSLRAVELCGQHPGKMWRVHGEVMTPVLPFALDDSRLLKRPWHSLPYQVLPEVWVQNASLEIARTATVFEKRSIAGDIVMPFFTKEYEGFDINTPRDWEYAEQLVKHGGVMLPKIGG